MRLSLIASLIVNCVVIADAIFPGTFDLEQLLAFTARQAEEKVDQILSRCYGEYGCFTLGGKFVSMARPVNLFPYAVETLAVKMALYTRNNPNLAYLLTPNDVNQLNSSHFNVSNPTKVIVHGFLENGKTQWCTKMKNELIVYDDFNVIVVDWIIGALPPYTQAVANARLVGAIIARFFQLLQRKFDYQPENVHIIGHSLGAHVAGYVGQRLFKLGRISGLDPAGPYFENTDNVVKLDTTDALFVDVIHTDGSSILNRAFGMVNPIGHVDFYPNGGSKQPGCEDSVSEALEREDMDLYRGFRHWVACRHVRAHEYFTESINSACRFQAFECDTYDNFLAGRCTDCSDSKCARMGFHADEHMTTQKSIMGPARMFLKTNSNPPFCTIHYLVRIQTTGHRKLLFDDLQESTLYFQFDGDKRRSEQLKANTPAKSLDTKDHSLKLISSSRLTSPLRRLQIFMSEPNQSSITNQIARIFQGENSIDITTVYTENLETGRITQFCGGFSSKVKPGSNITLYPRLKC